MVKGHEEFRLLIIPASLTPGIFETRVNKS
jgi:hypothetical protein